MINPDSASLAAHTSHGDSATSQNDPIFWPLTFRSGLTVKNRIFRSNISGQFDKYNGQGTQTRIDWETSFARGGVGCILSSYAPVHVRGRILVRYAMIDSGPAKFRLVNNPYLLELCRNCFYVFL